jgi:SulP family sulfate permease
VLFIHRMSKATAIETHTPFVGEDKPDASGAREPYDHSIAANPDTVAYRISGAFFFGAAASIGSVLDRISDRHKTLIVDFSAVPFLDSTGANTIVGLARKAARRGVNVVLTGTSSDIRRELTAHGATHQLVTYERTLELALAAASRPA